MVRRYIFGVGSAWSTARTPGERYWFIFYGVASTVFRLFISIRIMLYLNDILPEEFSIVVPVLIFSALVGWVFMPIGKFFRYLATGPELARSRIRALACTAAFTGTLNLYLSAVDDLLGHEDDKPTIGLLLCKSKDRMVVEYALDGYNRPMGVAEWETSLTQSLPEEFKSSLPTIEQIEAELGDSE